MAHTGHTVHVVPGEKGVWNVVDLQRRGETFATRDEAVRRAKHIAEANQPSQVVVLDTLGRIEPIARYRLPEYRASQGNEAPLFEAAVKSMLIASLVGAGIAVLGELVERVEREVKREVAKSRRTRKTVRRSRAS